MIPDAVIAAFIPVSAVLAILFGVFLWKRVSAIQLTGSSAVLRSQNGREYLLEEGESGSGEEEVRCARAFPCDPGGWGRGGAAALALGQRAERTPRTAAPRRSSPRPPTSRSPWRRARSPS
jgi:hypothetical protein